MKAIPVDMSKLNIGSPFLTPAPNLSRLASQSARGELPCRLNSGANDYIAFLSSDPDGEDTFKDK